MVVLVSLNFFFFWNLRTITSSFGFFLKGGKKKSDLENHSLVVRVFFWKHQRSGGFHERTGKELAVRMVGLLKNFQTFEKPRLNFIPRTGFFDFLETLTRYGSTYPRVEKSRLSVAGSNTRATRVCGGLGLLFCVLRRKGFDPHRSPVCASISIYHIRP